MRAPRTALENDELAEEELEAGELQPAVTRGIAARDAYLKLFENPLDMAEGIAKRA